MSRVQVRLWYENGALQLCISDDGRGAAAFPDTTADDGHGLVGMQERVAAYGGSLHSGPRTGGGFEVIASLPLDAEVDDSSAKGKRGP